MFTVCLFSIEPIYAQWGFTATIRVTGKDCGGYTPPALPHITGFPTKSECERVRNMIIAIRESGGGCTVYYTCTPCTGKNTYIGGDNPLDNSSASGSTNFGGVNKPSSLGIDTGNPYFSPNASQSIPILGKDFERKEQALSNGGMKFELGTPTKDNVYNNEYIKQLQDAINKPRSELKATDFFYNLSMRRTPSGQSAKDLYPEFNPPKELIDNYLNEWSGELEGYTDNTFNYVNVGDFLAQLYKEKTGRDIDEIINKTSLTDDDKKIIREYNEFAEKAADKIISDLSDKKARVYREVVIDENGNEINPKRELDMVFIANDVYDPGSEVVGKTDWRPLWSSEGIDNPQIAKVIDMLHEFNKDGSNFYAAVYKNDITNEYTLAFRGTEMTSLKDWRTNGLQGVGVLETQYANAAMVGAMLSGCKDKIYIVGHSEGGGEATIAGVKAGLAESTYTYNQAELSNLVAIQSGINTLDISKVKAYHTTTDILTNGQTVIRSIVNIETPIGPVGLVGLNTNKNKNDIGTTTINPFEAHKMNGIQKIVTNKYSDTQNKWNNLNNIYSTVQSQRSDPDIIKKRRKLYPQFE